MITPAVVSAVSAEELTFAVLITLPVIPPKVRVFKVAPPALTTAGVTIGTAVAGIPFTVAVTTVPGMVSASFSTSTFKVTKAAPVPPILPPATLATSSVVAGAPSVRPPAASTL